MIRNISSLVAVALAVLVLSSCLNDDDDEATYYDDTAITAFSLGTLKVAHTTKAADGVTDSTYTTTLTGSTYRFNIDQMSNTIYNTDSLPKGTDAAHVLATITSKNSGRIILNLRSKAGADSLAYYSSSDSIDFTDPVRIRVYNMRATAYREYTVSVNVHKENEDDFSWKAAAVDGMESVTGKRIVTLSDGFTYIIGMREGQYVVYRKSGNGWEETSPLFDPSSAYSRLCSTGSYDYAFGNSAILRAPAGTTAWSADSLDDSASLLPASDVSIVARASQVNEGAYNLTLIGNREGVTVVWGKVEENDNAAEPWFFYPYDPYNSKTLPYLSNIRAVAYGDGILATGGDFTNVYYSPDNGLTWESNSTCALPEAFGYGDAAFAIGVDSDNVIYITKDGSGEVWSGRLAKLGWSKAQTVFTRAARR